MKRLNIYYGWWVVAACLLIALYVMGIIHYGFTAFFEPIHGEFGWSYTQISFAASLRGMEMGLLSPLFGIFVDRWGSRRLLLGGVALFGMALIFLSFTGSLLTYYLSFALIAIGVSCTIGTVPSTAVAHWFHDRNISTALGITSCGAGLGGLLIPLVVQLIATYGWRNTLIITGVATFVFIMPLVLLIKNRPPDSGSIADSHTAEGQAAIQPPVVAVKDAEARQALSSATFWHLSPSFICHAIIMNAIITHVMPYLSSVGVPRTTAGFVASLVMLVSIVGRLGSGWLGDRVSKKRLSFFNFFSMSIGLLAFSQVSGERLWLIVPFIIFFCVGYGGNFTLSSTLIVEYFGRRRFGTINGSLIGTMGIGGISGPLLAGWVYDTQGNYNYLWPALAALAFISAVNIVTTPKYNRGLDNPPSIPA